MVNDKKKIKVTYIKLDGYVDAETAVDFENSLQALLNQGKRLVLLDCREIRYVSDAGIGALISAQRLFREGKSCLVFYNLSEEVAQVARFLNLHEELNLAQDRKKALQIVAQCAREYDLLVESSPQQPSKNQEDEVEAATQEVETAAQMEQKLDLSRNKEAASHPSDTEKTQQALQNNQALSSEAQQEPTVRTEAQAPSPQRAPQSSEKDDIAHANSSFKLQQAISNSLRKSSKTSYNPSTPTIAANTNQGNGKPLEALEQKTETSEKPFEKPFMPKVYHKDEALSVQATREEDEPVEFADIVPDDKKLMTELADVGISEQGLETHQEKTEEPIHALMEDFYHQPQEESKKSDDLYYTMAQGPEEQKGSKSAYYDSPPGAGIGSGDFGHGDDGTILAQNTLSRDSTAAQKQKSQKELEASEVEESEERSIASQIWPVLVNCASCGEISKAPEPGNYACPYCDSEFIVSVSGKLFFRVETDESL